MRGLYVIVDIDALARSAWGGGAPREDLDPAPFAEAILEARPAAIQLRDKRGSSAATLARLRRIAPLAARAGVPLFANDRADLAILAGCAGVHVGQEDMPVAEVRAAAREASAALLVGLSTHDAGQLDGALAERPDYVALGPIFATQNKERPSPVVGPALLAELAGRARSRGTATPIVAIGGITERTAAEVGAQCDMVAVIGALLPERSGAPGLDEAREKAARLIEIIALAQREPRGRAP